MPEKPWKKQIGVRKTPETDEIVQEMRVFYKKDAFRDELSDAEAVKVALRYWRENHKKVK